MSAMQCTEMVHNGSGIAMPPFRARPLVTGTGTGGVSTAETFPGGHHHRKIANGHFVTRRSRATKRPLSIDLALGAAPGKGPGGTEAAPPGTGH
jgi:hypothetical protein